MAVGASLPRLKLGASKFGKLTPLELQAGYPVNKQEKTPWTTAKEPQ
jgi:hypothetical protein